MKKILLVLTRPPYPAIDGTRERILNEISNLCSDFELDLLIIGNENLNTDQQKFLIDLGVKTITSIKMSKIKSYINALLSLPTSLPIQSSYFYSQKAYNLLKKIAPEYFAIHFHTLRFGQYISKLKSDKVCPSTRLLLAYNDAISLNYQDAAVKAKGVWKYIYKIEASRISPYETKLLSMADGFSVVSARDRNHIVSNWQKKYPNQQAPTIEVIRNGIKDEVFNNNYNPQNNNLVFIGNLLYPPNKQGLKFFCENIFPLIITAHPNTKLTIIGKGSLEHFSNYQNCEPMGFVDNPFPILTTQALFISPADFGAGVPTKSLLAMAIGLPVVSTATNAQGIDGIIDNENICLIDYKQVKVSADIIIKALDNIDYRNKIGRAGKELMEQKYKQSLNYPTLENFILGE